MFDLIIFGVLVALGYSVGTILEKRHYRAIEERERALLSLPAITAKHAGVDDSAVQNARMVYGSAVVSIDYFKRLLAGLRNIFGGTVTSYESLVDRARREAVLRMKEMAQGASLIVNVRVETSTVGKHSHKKSIGCLEAVAYGTALTVKDNV